MGQRIKHLAGGHRTFTGKLSERQGLTIPSWDPDHGDLGQTATRAAQAECYLL
jgi:hypothetical protein